MASIEHRGTSWSVRWRQPGDTRLTRKSGFPTKSDAEAFKREVEACVAAGRRWQPRAVRPKFDAVAKKYLRWAVTRLAPRTLVERGHQLDRFKAWRWPTHVDPQWDVTIEDLEAWSDAMVARGLSRLTANVHARAVRTVWAWAAGRQGWRGVIPEPTRLVLPQGRTRVKPAAPTWEEMDKIIEACGDNWYRHLYLVERYLGLRSLQVLHLRWEDVDLEDASLHIPPDLPGSKSAHEKQGRWVPLSPHLVEEMRTWPRSEQGWLIDRTYGVRRASANADGRWINSATIKRIWKRAKVRPELRAQPTHCFRKGFRTLLIAAGARPELVSYLQGRSLGLDGDVYTIWRMLEGQLREVVGSIPQTSTSPAANSQRP